MSFQVFFKTICNIGTFYRLIQGKVSQLLTNIWISSDEFEFLVEKVNIYNQQLNIWRSIFDRVERLCFWLLDNNRSWFFIKFWTSALELLYSFLQFQNFIEQVPHHDKWVFKLAAFQSWLRFKGLFPEEFWWMLPCGSAFHTQDQFS